MTLPNILTSLAPQTMRRMAYRVAGQVLALTALHVPIRRISIVALENSDEPLGEVEVLDGCKANRDQAAFAYKVGEWAADHYGAPREYETQSSEPPDLSSIENIIDDIPKFGERMIGPITAIAEALLVFKKLSEVQLNRIILTELKKTKSIPEYLA